MLKFKRAKKKRQIDLLEKFEILIQDLKSMKIQKEKTYDA